MERLLGCPFAWVLRHAAGVRPGVLRAIPDGARLLGTLAHAVIAELLTERSGWPPDEAARRAAALFDRLLPVLAAPLLRPGWGLELERACAAIAAAASTLAGLIAEAGLSVRGCEVPVEAELDGVTVEGIVDLLLEGPDGLPVVLDLKWSGSDKRRRREIAEGRGPTRRLWTAAGGRTGGGRANVGRAGAGRLLHVGAAAASGLRSGAFRRPCPCAGQRPADRLARRLGQPDTRAGAFGAGRHPGPRRFPRRFR
ncbi:PD-(D/E)XK nuclease family protein [Azospirillum agricola]|uniref:PD-(D/E)XK nuclease family protein n=1 Tax=Azospirillum agricola TaxID=1720247 RepID=UPI001CBC4F19|nr:PD-(D/E)XK nuclease family protein [Azospirillum agricola]